MNTNQAIQAVVGISAFCARHLFAFVVIVAVPCVLWTVAYLALLLWAMISGGGIGGPLAYPAGLLVILVAATVASLVLLFPSTALAEWFAKRRGFPILAQLPISVAVLALLCLVLVAVAAAVDTGPSFQGVAVGFGVLFIAHLLPLGLYWWTAQSGPLLLSLLKLLRSTLAGAVPNNRP